jgi:uncharacterized repeat protein (TIGR01451 family)
VKLLKNMIKRIFLRKIKRNLYQLRKIFFNRFLNRLLNRFITLNQPNFRRRTKAGILSLFFISCSLSFVLDFGIPKPALAAPLMNVLIRDPNDGGEGTTGVAPFDANNNPGNDSGENNEYVRTSDFIEYDFNYNVLDDDAENIKFVSTLPKAGDGTLYMDWVRLPPQCSGTGSVISADKQTLTCVLSKVTAGTTSSVIPKARVRGSTPNGTVLKPSVTMTSTTVGANTVNREGYYKSDNTESREGDIVSAAPIFDLQKKAWTSRFTTNGPGGKEGYYLIYHVGVALPPGKGSGTTPLADSITFTDRLNLAANDPATSSIRASNPANLSLELVDCGLNGDPNDNVEDIWTYPFGKIGIRGGATAENSVQDSGSISCSQPGGIASDFTITINNLNTNADTVPAKNINNQTLADKYVFSGYMRMFVPLKEVATAEQEPGIGTNTNNGTVWTKNTFTPLTAQAKFDPTQTNKEPDLANNTTENGAYYTKQGSMAKYFLKNPHAHLDHMIWGVNHGHVAPNQVFSIRLDFNNGTPRQIDDFTMCDRIDTSKYVLSEASGSAVSSSWLPSGQVYRLVAGNSTIDNNSIVEFSDEPLNPSARYGWRTGWTIQPPGSTEQWIPCTNDNTSGNWRPLSAFTKSADNTYPTITKIRVRLKNVPPIAEPNNNSHTRYANFAVKALPNPIDTILPNWASGTQPGVNGDKPFYGGYWEATLIPSVVRIEKAVDVTDVQHNQVINYTLKPRTATILPNPATFKDPVVVIDTLPKGLNYEKNSARPEPKSVTVQANGTTEIVWEFNDVIPGQPMSEITYKARVDFSVPNKSTLTNTVAIRQPEDTTPERVETGKVAQTSVTITAPGALSVGKSTSTPLINPNETMSFKLGYANPGTVAASSTAFIDILPYNRSKLSSRFNGGYTLESISGSFGETYEYTTVAPDQINIDPGCPSNGGIAKSGCRAVTPSVTPWQALPASAPYPTDITAIRVKGGALPAGSGSRFIDLSFKTNGNKPRDLYANQFAGRTNLSALPVVSNIVIVEVPGPDAQLQMVKRITAVNGQNTYKGINLNQVVDDPSSIDDNSPKWPLNYLKGVAQLQNMNSGEELEYTIYYLSGGKNTPLKNVKLCDQVPAKSTFIPGSITFSLGNTTNPISDDQDSDKGHFIAAGVNAPGLCKNPPDINQQLTAAENTRGAVWVDVVNGNTTLPETSTSPAYGYFRFRVKVDKPL